MKIVTIFFCLSIYLSSVHRAFALELPEWEWGGVYVEGTIPHYLGSNHYYHRHLLLPYFYYRTPNYQLGDSNKFYLLKGDNHNISLNLSAKLPVSSPSLKEDDLRVITQQEKKIISNSNETRKGMDDLPLVIFLGIKQQSFFGEHFYTNMALMAGIPLSSNHSIIGKYFSPSFNFDFYKNTDPQSLIFSLSWLIGDQDYNNYYYGVSAEDALINRPSYKAKAGLVATTTGLGISLDLTDRITILAGYYQHNMGNSVVKDSPLVIVESSQSVIAAFIYTFGVSEKTVTIPK
jgi:hypothetical protein